MNLYKLNPEIIAYDMHPQYLSSQFALNIPYDFEVLNSLIKTPVQHHHAHAVSCMTDNNITGETIALLMDGTGYGTDGTIWGGEIFIAGLKDYKRIGSFKPLPLPGGDIAIIKPWRMSLSYLYMIYKDDWFDHIPDSFKNLSRQEMDFAIYQIKNSAGHSITTSCGRLFDAVSALSGICMLSTYDGQPAIMLENAIENNITDELYIIEMTDMNGMHILDWSIMIKQIINDIRNNTEVSKIAKKFHDTLIYTLSELCKIIRAKHGLNDIILSGGCFMNFYLTGNLVKILKKSGFKVYIHKNVPANDAGISLGQAVIAYQQNKEVL